MLTKLRAQQLHRVFHKTALAAAIALLVSACATSPSSEIASNLRNEVVAVAVMPATPVTSVSGYRIDGDRLSCLTIYKCWRDLKLSICTSDVPGSALSI